MRRRLHDRHGWQIQLPAQVVPQRPALDVEDDLSLLLAQEVETAEDGGESPQVVGHQEGVAALLRVGGSRRSLLEPVKDLRDHLAENGRGAPGHVGSPVAGTPVVAPEEDVASQACFAEKPPEFAQVALLADALLGDERRFRGGPCVPLLACKYLSRPVQLDGLAVDRVAQ